MSTGSSIQELNLREFDAVSFIDPFCESLKKLNVLYPNDWHTFMGISDGRANFIDSNGGKFSVDITSKVISSVNRYDE